MKTMSYMSACLIALVLVVACQSAAAPEVIEREIEVTREVQVAGETRVETKVEEVMVEVTKEVQVAGETRIERVMVVATPTPVPTPSAVEEGPSGELIAAADDLVNMSTDNLGLLSVPQSSIYMEEMFDFLVDLDFDNKLVPGLAESWELSDDQLTWTFKIREGVKFHDGSDVTAEDVAYSWNRTFFDPRGGNSTALEKATRTESLTAASDHEFVIKTHKPEATAWLWGSFPEITSGSFTYSKAQIEADEEAFRVNPVGTGPYEFDSRIPNQFITMTASPVGHWRKDPGFQTVTILEIPELATRMALLKTGAADIIGASISSKEEILENNLQVFSAPSTTVSVIWCWYQWSPGHPCNDPKIREAIAISIDRQTIADRLYLGEAFPIGNFVAAPNTFGYDPTLEPQPYDPDRAKQLMAESTFPDGFEVQIETYLNDSDFPGLPTLAEAVLGYLGEIGITGEVKVYDWTNLSGTLRTRGQNPTPEERPYPLVVRGNDSRYTTLRWMNGWYHSTNSVRPVVGDSTPHIDVLLDSANAEFDLDKQEEFIREYNRVLTQEFRHAPLITANAVFGISNKVKEWTPITGRPFPHNFWSARPH